MVIQGSWLCLYLATYWLNLVLKSQIEFKMIVFNYECSLDIQLHLLVKLRTNLNNPNYLKYLQVDNFENLDIILFYEEGLDPMLE